MLDNEWVGDFRHEAIEASQEILRGTAADHVIGLNVSVCLPTDNSKSALKTGLVLFVVSVLLAIAFGAAAFSILSWQAGLPDDHKNGTWQLVAFVCMPLALCCMLIPHKGGGIAIRPFLGNRLLDLKSDPNVSSVDFVCSIEDPQTFSKIKAIPEVVGYLGHDPINQRIVVEGVLCRYVIHSRDVVQLNPVFAGSSPGTRIACRIDDHATLDIVIEQMHLLDETIRQLTGKKRNRGFEKICATLGIVEVDSADEA